MGVNVGNVTVRFSVQDQEAVRKALEQLGRDGDAALRKIDAAGKPVSKTMGSVSEIMGDLRTRAAATAESLGPVGTFLTSLGPAGLAAGAAIGVTVAGLFKLADGADQLADKAGRIRDFGQQVGLTVAQVQALEIAGADVGLKAEKIAAGLGKLSAEMEQTRRGTGALFEEAQRISPEFAEQLARARDLTPVHRSTVESLGRTDGVAAQCAEQGSPRTGHRPRALVRPGQRGRWTCRP